MFDSLLTTGLFDRMLTLMQQWREGMLACLSPAARHHFLPRQSPFHMDIEGDRALIHSEVGGERQELGSVELRTSKPERLVWETLSRSKEPLILRLPESWILRKTISLPAAAAENLRQVIEFEMDRLTPFPADQVYFDFHVEGATGAEMLSVDVALVPRKKVAPWLSLLRDHGISCHSITGSMLWYRANLLPQSDRPGFDLVRGLMSTLPYLLLLGLLAVAMLLPLWQQQEVVAHLTAEEAELRMQAQEVTGIRDSLEQAEQRIDLMLEAKTGTAPVLEVLRVLTEILPDDTWVQQLDLKGKRVELRGLSEQSSALLKLLEETGGFKNVEFLSSVVQQRGKERFHLSAEVVSPFPEGIEGIRLPEAESLIEPAPDQVADDRTESVINTGSDRDVPLNTQTDAETDSSTVNSKKSPSEDQQ